MNNSSQSHVHRLPKRPYCFARCQNIQVPKFSGPNIFRAKVSQNGWKNLFVKRKVKVQKIKCNFKNSFKPHCPWENEEKTALILIVDAGCTIHKKVFRGATTILLFPISNYVLYCKEGSVRLETQTQNSIILLQLKVN